MDSANYHLSSHASLSQVADESADASCTKTKKTIHDGSSTRESPRLHGNQIGKILKGVQSRFLRNQIINGASFKKVKNDPPMVAFSSIDARTLLPDDSNPAY